MTKRKAVVAMSGGVDSSVTAALLVEQGYDVTGIMLKLWKGEAENNASGCCNLDAAEDARRVADNLGIPFYVLNFAERFEETVVRDFKAHYSAGLTPNPCVRCNQWVKFDALLERAKALGAEVLATGHYARRREEDGRFRLLRGVDRQKDQSYVLWMLSQAELSQCLFPVGEMNKTETRSIATELGLRTATKADSMEICFVREGDMKRYVAENIPAASVPGPLVDMSGNVLGDHRGIGNYTVGQRKGLGIALGEPVFVTSIDATSNTVTVGSKEDLDVEGFIVDEASFVGPSFATETSVAVQHRAHGETNEAVVSPLGDGRLEVRYARPVSAISPGQSAAFYDPETAEELLGGGIIAATLPVAV